MSFCHMRVTHLLFNPLEPATELKYGKWITEPRMLSDLQLRVTGTPWDLAPWSSVSVYQGQAWGGQSIGGVTCALRVLFVKLKDVSVRPMLCGSAQLVAKRDPQISSRWMSKSL